MNLTNPIEIDEMELLYGSPIAFYDICYIYHPVMSDIAIISYKKFKEYLCVFMSDPKVIYNPNLNIDQFDFILEMSSKNPEYHKLVVDAFRFITHEEVIIIEELRAIQIGNNADINKLLTKEKFREFQKILKVIYWYDNDLNYREPENKRAAEIMNKLKKGQEMVAKVKANRGNDDDDNIDLSTMIASLGLYYKDLTKVWQLPYYTFFTQIKLMQYKEEYETNLKSVLAGAKVPKNKMKYWIRRVHQDNIGGN